MELTGFPSSLVSWLSKSMRGLPISWSFSENEEIFVVQLVWKKVKVQIDISQLHSSIQQFAGKQSPKRERKSARDRKNRNSNVQMTDNSTQCSSFETTDSSTQCLIVELIDSATQCAKHETANTATQCFKYELNDISTQCSLVELINTATQCEKYETVENSTQCFKFETNEIATQCSDYERTETSTQCVSCELIDSSTQCSTNQMCDNSSQCTANEMYDSSTQCSMNQICDNSSQCTTSEMYDSSTQCSSLNETIDISTQSEIKQLVDISTQCITAEMVERAETVECSSQTISINLSDNSTQCVPEVQDNSTQNMLVETAKCSTQTLAVELSENSTQCSTEVKDSSTQSTHLETAKCSTQTLAVELSENSTQCSTDVKDSSTQYVSSDKVEIATQSEYIELKDSSTESQNSTDWLNIEIMNNNTKSIHEDVNNNSIGYMDFQVDGSEKLDGSTQTDIVEMKSRAVQIGIKIGTINKSAQCDSLLTCSKCTAEISDVSILTLSDKRAEISDVSILTMSDKRAEISDVSILTMSDKRAEISDVSILTMSDKRAEISDVSILNKSALGKIEELYKSPEDKTDVIEQEMSTNMSDVIHENIHDKGMCRSSSEDSEDFKMPKPKSAKLFENNSASKPVKSGHKLVLSPDINNVTLRRKKTFLSYKNIFNPFKRISGKIGMKQSTLVSPSRLSRKVQSPSRLSRSDQSPARLSRSIQSPSRLSHSVQSPSRLRHSVQSPSRLRCKVSSPARLRCTSQSPARFSQSVQSPAKFQCKNWIPQSPARKHCCTSPAKKEQTKVKSKSSTSLITQSPRVRFYSGNSGPSKIPQSPFVKFTPRKKKRKQTNEMTPQSNDSPMMLGVSAHSFHQKCLNNTTTQSLVRNNSFNSPSVKTKVKTPKLNNVKPWINSLVVPSPLSSKKRKRSISTPQGRRDYSNHNSDGSSDVMPSVNELSIWNGKESKDKKNSEMKPKFKLTSLW